MRLEEIRKILEATPVWEAPGWCDRVVIACHASDLISDILAFRGVDSLLLTGLTNQQVVRMAELLDFDAICFVRGKKPQPETLDLAKEKSIPLLQTALSMYECCGRLYAKGLPIGLVKKDTSDCQPQR